MVNIQEINSKGTRMDFKVDFKSLLLRIPKNYFTHLKINSRGVW